MACMTVSDKYIITAEGSHIDCYDYSNHNTINLSLLSSPEQDRIFDITVSSDHKYLSLITSTSKQLLLFSLPSLEKVKSYVLPRNASKIRFTIKNDYILVADKTGEVILYDINNDSENGKVLLGHISLLLDVVQTNNGKYIITSDRDEKIKVSCYPDTYNIETYCLDHKEYVNHLEFLPHDDNYLTSTSGDGTIKIWNYVEGSLQYTIDSNNDVTDNQLKEMFTLSMQEHGVDVTSLPILHYAITKVNENCSLLAVAVYSLMELLIYTINTEDNELTHNLEERLSLENVPAGICFHNSSLFVYDNDNQHIIVYKVLHSENKICLEVRDKIKVFENINIGVKTKENISTLKLFYKRKFDNVQEYQERKRIRLEKEKSKK